MADISGTLPSSTKLITTVDSHAGDMHTIFIPRLEPNGC